MIVLINSNLADDVIRDIERNAPDATLAASWSDLLLSLGGNADVIAGLPVTRGTMYAIALLIKGIN